jgi:hypothetical protein
MTNPSTDPSQLHWGLKQSSAYPGASERRQRSADPLLRRTVTRHTLTHELPGAQRLRQACNSRDRPQIRSASTAAGRRHEDPDSYLLLSLVHRHSVKTGYAPATHRREVKDATVGLRRQVPDHLGRVLVPRSHGQCDANYEGQSAQQDAGEQQRLLPARSLRSVRVHLATMVAEQRLRLPASSPIRPRAVDRCVGESGLPLSEAARYRHFVASGVDVAVPGDRQPRPVSPGRSRRPPQSPGGTRSHGRCRSAPPNSARSSELPRPCRLARPGAAQRHRA